MANHVADSTARKLRIIAGLTAALAAAGVATAAAASADPITCPAGQTSVQTGPSTWDCVNGGGNTSNAEDPRNPNASKGDF
jgi:hypothetical protein